MSTKEDKGLKMNITIDLEVLTDDFHKFWCMSVSVGGYQEITKEGPHIMFT
jgi:hypothetical protein